MELLFVALGGALLGILARYTLPRRLTNGALLVPAIGTASASILWVALTWVGFTWDGGWIWWISLGLSAATSAAAAVLIGRQRELHDARRLADLSSGRIA